MSAARGFNRIDVAAAKALIQSQAPLILDARDEAAFARARIAGAQRLSSGNIANFIGSADRNAAVLIYCYRGKASLEHAQTFADFRFARVFSLDGGFEAWTAAAATDRAAFGAPLENWLEENGFSPGSIEAVLANQTTPLMLAAHRGELEICRLLLAAGVDKNRRNSDGNNALWLACVGRHRDIVALLVAAGVDIDNKNDNDATALMYAASSGKAEIVEQLLSLGADLEPVTLDGFSALDMAATIECLTLLRAKKRAKN